MQQWMCANLGALYNNSAGTCIHEIVWDSHRVRCNDEVILQERVKLRVVKHIGQVVTAQRLQSGLKCLISGCKDGVAQVRITQGSCTKTQLVSTASQHLAAKM